MEDKESRMTKTILKKAVLLNSKPLFATVELHPLLIAHWTDRLTL
jgi:hypothetical protein